MAASTCRSVGAVVAVLCQVDEEDDDSDVVARRSVSELEDANWLTARRSEGWSARRIAESLGVDRGRVRQALRQAGLPTRIDRDVPELADAAWLTARREDRWPTRRIAAVLHVDRSPGPAGSLRCRAPAAASADPQIGRWNSPTRNG